MPNSRRKLIKRVASVYYNRPLNTARRCDFWLPSQRANCTRRMQGLCFDDSALSFTQTCAYSDAFGLVPSQNTIAMGQNTDVNANVTRKLDHQKLA
jgi:hypothetical protein